MSDKLQRKLDQETLSPVLAVFLRFLLVFYGLLDEHRTFDEDLGDSAPKITRIPISAVDLEIPKSAPGVRHYYDFMEHRREQARQHQARGERLLTDEVHRAPMSVPHTLYVDLGALGGVNVPVPEGAQYAVINPRTFIIHWTMEDLSVVETQELQEYMEQRNVAGNSHMFTTIPVNGCCTPSRSQMMTNFSDYSGPRPEAFR